MLTILFFQCSSPDEQSTKFCFFQASREEQTLALLAKFKQKLSGIKYDDDDEAKKNETKDVKKSDEKADEEEDEEIVGDDWMKNSLVFENDAPVLAKDASSKDDDWFVFGIIIIIIIIITISIIIIIISIQV